MVFSPKDEQLFFKNQLQSKFNSLGGDEKQNPKHVIILTEEKESDQKKIINYHTVSPRIYFLKQRSSKLTITESRNLN